LREQEDMTDDWRTSPERMIPCSILKHANIFSNIFQNLKYLLNMFSFLELFLGGSCFMNFHDIDFKARTEESSRFFYPRSDRTKVISLSILNTSSRSKPVLSDLSSSFWIMATCGLRAVFF